MEEVSFQIYKGIVLKKVICLHFLFFSSETLLHLLEVRLYYSLHIKSSIILTTCITRAIQFLVSLNLSTKNITVKSHGI